VTVWSRAAGPPPEGAPFALVERTTRGLVLTAINPAARALGLHSGQAHADARAIAPQLESVPAEPEHARAALERLALWAERFSPCVAIDGDQAGLEGLFLDMTGGAHLFGGEARLLAEIERRLAAAAIPARAAIADAPGGAWALARFGDRRLAPVGCTRETLHDLPVEALRLSEGALKLLRRFGLKRIGDLYALPRAGLARRFGERAPSGKDAIELVRRLDQALGVDHEPLAPVRPAPLYRAWRAFAEPMIDMEGVAWALPALVQALATQLERDGRGARRLVLTAFRVDGRTTSIEAGLSAPAAAPAHLLRLLKERGLERLDLGFGADALMLSAGQPEALSSRQGELASKAGGAMAGEAALAALIDRIEAKLGEGSVVRPVLRQSHIPERSEAWTAAGTKPAGTGGELDGPPRPLFLFDPPEPIETLAGVPDSAPAHFVWRRVTRKVFRAEGPERLSPEWWRAKADPRGERTRDYFRVEDEDGRRYWLYREGLYGREDQARPPSWWMHGVFV